jgi:phosphoglycolate phosphatase-like HAD superfamily hydrolase
MHPDDDIQAWLVDLDGTLVDTLGDFVAALGQVAEQLGRTPPTRDWVRCAIGRGGERLLRDALRHWNLPDYRRWSRREPCSRPPMRTPTAATPAPSTDWPKDWRRCPAGRWPA